MNGLLWIAQIVLAGAFLNASLSKILVFKREKTAALTPLEASCPAMPNGLAAAIALLEIAGALGLLIPVHFWSPNFPVLFAASGLALLAVIVGIHQARCHEHTTPTLTMFLLALFVIVGRWPVQTSLH